MSDITEERFVAKRIIKLCYLAIMMLVSGLMLGALHRLSLGDILALMLIDVLFAVLFIFYLENDRLHRMDEPDSSEDYQRTCVGFTAGMLIMLAASFFPEYTAPVLFISFMLATGLSREQAFIIAVFFDAQLALNGKLTANALACYLLMTLLGIILTDMYEQKDYRKYAEMITLALSIAIPVLFYYILNGTPTFLLFLYSLVSGVLAFLGMHFWYDTLHYKKMQAYKISLDTIVDPSYHLVREIRKFSKVDYSHALRVSRIAAHCAAKINADEKIAAVGGFYYRLGKLGGEPFVENGVKIAQNNLFPNEIVAILSEYNGKQKPISSIESAIVHITDAVVTKFELLDQTTLSSTWNRDMVIYQTLNEKSSSGIYDNSGLSMNQFLKIREFLAKEEELL